MTSDDQQFLDLLASVPQDVMQYGSRIADYIEKHTNAIASDIRDVLDSATWLPESMKPPQRQSHHFFPRAPPPPQGFVERTTAWVLRNRTTIAIVVAFAGTTAYLVHRRKKAHARKRRAKKLANGSKREIVILACASFQDPLTRSLALDLERRGYIVYVTLSSTEEESQLNSEAKPDLRALWMDMTSTVPNPTIDTHPNLEPIRELISRSPGTPPPSKSTISSQHNLTLAGVVVLPGTSGYPTQPLVTLQPSSLVDTVNTRLLAPVLMVQQILPLLSSNSIDPKSPAAIVLAYPTISLALTPPDALPEVLAASAMSSLAATLRREVKVARSNITITELKLGNFDGGSSPARNNVHNNETHSQSQFQTASSSHWHSTQRAITHRPTQGQSTGIRGTCAREFHNAVFDALTPPQTVKAFGKLDWLGPRRSTVVFVGSGARFYDTVNKMLPTGLVGWMMGYEKRGARFANLDMPEVVQKPVETNPWDSSSHNSESGVWEKV